MTDGKAADIPEFNPLQMRPQAFARIQFRGIGRQALQVETLRRPSREEFFDDVTARNRRPIPDEHQAAWYLPQQMLQKDHDIGRVERPFLAAKIQLALGRYRGDGREMVAGVPLPQDGGLADWGVGADHTGQGIEPGFVDEKEALPPSLRPPLMVGQVSSRQRAIAASSRWRARRAGFCGLQRIALSKRPTCTG
jgi:hypothetical protein